MVVRVVVCGLRGEKETIDVCHTEEQFKSITVLQLKEKIYEKWPEWRPDPMRLRHPQTARDGLFLIYEDKQLEDSSLLSSYGIQHMSVILTLLRLSGGGDLGMGDGGMGDKEGKNRSMERLFFL